MSSSVKSLSRVTKQPRSRVSQGAEDGGVDQGVLRAEAAASLVVVGLSGYGLVKRDECRRPVEFTEDRLQAPALFLPALHRQGRNLPYLFRTVDVSRGTGCQ